MAFSAFSQKVELEVNTSYGRSTVEDSKNVLFQFKSKGFDFVQTGINGILSPSKAPFEGLIGVSYVFRGKEDSKYQFIRVPVGINFKYDDRFIAICGLGLSANFPISIYDIWNDGKNYSKVQLGLNVKLGIGYRLNDHYAICLSFDNSFDQSELYNKTLNGWTGSTVAQYFGSDSYLTLGLRKALRF